MSTKLWRKLESSKKYREAFVASHFKRAIPFQITAMRKKAGLSQEQLAEACGLTQGVISRAENPNYGNLTFNTVLRIAAGLDVAFVGWFVPFSQVVERFDKLSEESVQVPTFEEESRKIDESSTRQTTTVKDYFIVVPSGELNATGGISATQIATAVLSPTVIRGAVGKSVGHATVKGVSEDVLQGNTYPFSEMLNEITRIAPSPRGPFDQQFRPSASGGMKLPIAERSGEQRA